MVYYGIKCIGGIFECGGKLMWKNILKGVIVQCRKSPVRRDD